MTSDPNEPTFYRLPRQRTEPPVVTDPDLAGQILARYDADESAIYDPLDQGSLLRNPYVLAGLAVCVAIVLAVMVVIVFGNRGGGTASSASSNGSDVFVLPLTPEAGGGLSARSIATSTVRESPRADAVEIGLLRSGQDVEVIGRNAESTWYQIYYPQKSQLRGWVVASALRLPTGSSEALAIVTATVISRPTPPPQATQVLAAEPTGTTTATPTTTPTAGPSPDLQVSLGGPCILGQRLIVNIINAGPGPLTTRPVSVGVQTIDGTARALASRSLTLAPGAAVTFDTGYVIAESVLAVIDPGNALGDPNPGNNRVACMVAGVGIPTRQPGPPGSLPTQPLPQLPTSTPTRTPVNPN